MSRVALVVGINKYNGLRDLSAPANDAEAIAQKLEKYGNFTVIRLPEAINPNTKKPYVSKESYITRKQLQEQLISLFCPDSKQAPDTALFYFSGHGLLQTRGVREGFLATSDSDPNSGHYEGLSLRWLRELLQESQINQQIVWLDCCHSGAMLNMREADAGGAGNVRDRCFIAACRDFEVAYQSMVDNSYSVLTKALIDGLDSQQISSNGLDNLELTNFIKNELSGETQRPIFSNFGQPIYLIQNLEMIGKAKQEAATDAKCPYKGLAYFDDNDTDPQLFFGRSQLTNLLLDRIRQNNCLVLLGASGSGKSSVLRAGLLNQLRQGRQLSGSDRWKIQTIVPTEHPLKSLAESFVDASNHIDRLAQLNKAENLLKDPNALRQLVETSDAPCLVLVVDQFEECFTLCQDMEERQQFFNLLINAITVHGDKFRLVIAMRADFFGKCVEHDYGGLAKQLEAHLVAITPMNDKELREAIAKPAEKVGCEVEPVLVDEIVKDVAGAPANLPLMQFALAELWKYMEGNQLTLNAYKKEFGGISGALEKRANAVYEEFSDADKKAVKHTFVLLTRLGERNEEDTRRRVVISSLVTPMFPIEAIDRVVKKLADENLVVTTTSVKRENVILDENNLNENPSENPTVTTTIVLPEKGRETNKDVAIVEVAHEALIRSWSKMRDWLEENREVRQQQQKLEERALEWEQSRKAKGFLLQGLPLQNAIQVNRQSVLNPSTQEFIKKSQRKQITSRFLIFGLLVVPSFTLLILLPIFVITQASAFITNKSCPPNPNAKFFLQILMANGYIKQLRGANLCNQKLDNFNFSGADITQGVFRDSQLPKANFSEAFLEETNFQNAFLPVANFRKAFLRKSNFQDAKLEQAKFENAYLGGANLRSTNLKGANLSGADLMGANLSGADLKNANLTGVLNLTLKQISDAKICNTILPSYIKNNQLNISNNSKSCSK